MNDKNLHDYKKKDSISPLYSINLDRSLSIPLYQQLYAAIRQLIIDREILSDTKLPSVKILSKQLNVNIVTIVTAYKQLESDGFVYASPGSGTYVKKYEIKLAEVQPSSNVVDELYAYDEMELLSTGGMKLRGDVIDLATTTPHSDLFPVNHFKQVMIETIDNDGADTFNYNDSMGFLPLREEILRRLKLQGINSNTQQIQIISGAQQGIDIVAKALLKKNDYVVVEKPTYSGAIAVFRAKGARILEIDIEQDGLKIDSLREMMKKYRPRIIYTIPTYQNPTSYSYSISKKQELIELVSSFGCYIIEDDSLSELSFDSVPPPSIKSFDVLDRVIFIKSFSKLLMPGLRIGYMVVPHKLQVEISEAKHTTDISTPGIIQRSFFRYLKNGYWEQHLLNLISFYKKKRDLMAKELKTLSESFAVDCFEPCYLVPSGGFSFWIRLNDNIDVIKLYYDCASNGVIFMPGSVFYLSGSEQKDAKLIRLSFAHASDTDIVKGISILSAAMEKYKV